MELTLDTAPVVEPVSLDQAKAQCVIDAEVTTDDTLLERFIAAVRMRGEYLTGKQFVSATYSLTLRAWNPVAVLTLPKPPLQSVESITYLDEDDVEQTLDASSYEIIAERHITRLVPVTEWPDSDKMVITYVTGWPVETEGEGEEATHTPTTPEDIQTWMLMRVADLYENRETFVIGQAALELPESFIDGFLDPHITPVVV